MRISDWSSDVCSADLHDQNGRHEEAVRAAEYDDHKQVPRADDPRQHHHHEREQGGIDQELDGSSSPDIRPPVSSWSSHGRLPTCSAAWASAWVATGLVSRIRAITTPTRPEERHEGK